jgi:hypothetical protein
MTESPRRVAALIVAAVIVLQACGVPPNRKPDLEARLSELIGSARPGDLIHLDEVIGPRWNRIVLFPPYQPNSVARRELGFDWDIESTPSQTRDSSVVLVMVIDDRAAGWMISDGSRGHFDLGGSPLNLEPGDTAFRLSLNSQGERQLVHQAP